MYYFFKRLLIGCKHEYNYQLRIYDYDYSYERIFKVYQCNKCHKIKKILLN